MGDERAGAPEKSALTHVVDHLEGMIFDELSPGDQLPSEGQLAEAFGVSRLTVREGVKQLSARGLIDTHNGRKPRVAIPNGRSAGDYFRSAIRRDPRSLLDLLEVRLALETHNASLAAIHASPPRLEAMEAALDEMARSVEDSGAFNEADIGFHELLAVATGNRMLATLIEELSAVLRASRDRSVAGHRRRGLDLEEVLSQHREILDRVRARDAEGAAAAMRQHLLHTRSDLAAAFEI